MEKRAHLLGHGAEQTTGGEHVESVMCVWLWGVRMRLKCMQQNWLESYQRVRGQRAIFEGFTPEVEYGDVEFPIRGLLGPRKWQGLSKEGGREGRKGTREEANAGGERGERDGGKKKSLKVHGRGAGIVREECSCVWNKKDQALPSFHLRSLSFIPSSNPCVFVCVLPILLSFPLSLALTLTLSLSTLPLDTPHLSFKSQRNMSGITTPAVVPAPVQVPASNGPSAIQKFVQDKDWKFFAAVASVSLIAGAGIYYLTKPSESAEEPKASKPKNKKKKNKKKSAAQKEAASEDKGELGTRTATTV